MRWLALLMVLGCAAPEEPHQHRWSEVGRRCSCEERLCELRMACTCGATREEVRGHYCPPV